MWTRSDLKQKAKEKMAKYYWPGFWVSAIAGIFAGSGSGVKGINNARNSISNAHYSVSGEDAELFLKILGIVAAVLIVTFIVGVIVKFFVGNVVIVGKAHFYLESRETGTSAGIKDSLFWGFKNGYGNIVKIMFLRDLYTWLWGLLLVIPGIIKYYEYIQIPFILAENPEISSQDAFGKTKTLMHANKFNTFVLQLSFIGWYFLGTLACGVGALFVNPYYDTTLTELYVALNNRNNNGYVEL